MNSTLSRRDFLRTASTAASAAALAPSQVLTRAADAPRPFASAGKPAILGGTPVRKTPFPAWPVFDQTEETALRDVLRSGKWFRGYGSKVNEFEEAYARLMGARHCIATANGTSALLASLGGLEIGPGDEVLLPPYTFVATLNVILVNHALPVFVDSDLATFQMDATKIPGALSERTAAIIPVHLGGGAADMDAILEQARPRQIPVVEDACQSHLAEWKGHKVGTLGTTGCFSFQASKNLNCGEGGAVLTNDEAVAERCYAFHNNCRPRGRASYNFSYLGGRGANLRLTEFQAALLLAQMKRLEAQSRVREQNAAHLSRGLERIPGLAPARMYPGCTRNAYHLFMFRYQPEGFGGLTRARFLEALAAEGIPASPGYSPLNRERFILETLASRAYRRIYPPEVLSGWEERNRCPVNEQLCQQAVWFTQTMLLGPRQDMDDILAAVEKIHAHASELAEPKA